MGQIKVGDIMTQGPVSIKPDTSLLECARHMIKKKVGSLILKNNEKIAGIVTQKDILWALVKKSKSDLSKIRARDVSKKKVHTTTPETTLDDAMKKMQRLKLQRLPVINNGRVVGMLTMKDIIGFNPGLASDLKSLFQLREEAEKLNRLSLSSDKSEAPDFQGICEECGEVDILERVDGRMLCESCKDDM